MALSPDSMKPSDVPETSRIRNYRFLALQGGGMKGIGYVGAIEALEATGVLSQLEEVAGSSAGAIVATLLAVGYTAKEIRETMTKLDFRDLQDKDSPGWVESTGLKTLLGGGLRELLKEQGKRKKPDVTLPIQKIPRPGATIVGGLETLESIGGLALGKVLGVWTGNALLNTVATMIARKTGKPNLTFRELEALAKDNPGIFCALTLTGSNLTTRELEYYNAKDWPDMPIMEAVRISASFPGAFKPVSKPIVKRIHEDGMVETSTGVRVDGGLLENLPDIFHKPPYFSPSHTQPDNPEALALSFQEEPIEKVRTGLDLAKALYKTKTSSKMLRRKYAGNIISVDPKGVGTLDFDADEGQISRLADSGQEAAQTFFRQILDQEKTKKPNFEAMSLAELIRKEIAIKIMIKKYEKEFLIPPKEQPIFNDLMVIQQWIEKKRGNRTTKDLNQMRAQERRRFRRMRAGNRSREVSTDNLVNACQRKIQELDNLEKELELRLKQINLVRMGLGLRAAELGARFQTEEEVPDYFKKQLEKLHPLQTKILNAKQQIASLELREDELNPSDQMDLKKYKDQCEEMAAQKRAIFEEIIQHYHKENDDLMVHYFEELQHDSENVLFNIPANQEAVEQRLKNEMEKGDRLFKETENAVNKVKSEKQLFEKRLQHFKDREISSEEYTTLAALQNDLNKSIRQNTNMLGKALNYCVSEQPSLKKNVITFLLQTLSFLTFAAKVGVAIGTVFPAVTYAAAQFIKRSSSNPKASAIAERVIRAFRMPNLFKLNKLRELSAMTAHVLEVINKNYNANVDKSEQTYLYHLFTQYLKTTGLSLKDILPRQDKETEKEYLERIKTFQTKLGINEPFKHLSDDLPIVFKKNMDRFESAVKIESNRSKNSLKGEVQFKKALSFRRNMDLIHLRYLQDMNKKFEKDKMLTPNELLEYIHSATAIQVKVPNSIQTLFFDNIKEKLQSSSGLRLTQEEFIAYLELEPELPSKEIADIRTMLSKDKEYQLWLSHYEPPKSKQEIEEAWQTFFAFTRKQRKGSPSPSPEITEQAPKEHTKKPQKPSPSKS